MTTLPAAKSELRDLIKYKLALTSREAEVVDLVNKGLANKEVGSVLFLTEKSVKWHMTNILAKTKCKNRKDLRKLIDKLCK